MFSPALLCYRLKFRPYANNPYMQVANNPDEEDNLDHNTPSHQEPSIRLQAVNRRDWFMLQWLMLRLYLPILYTCYYTLFLYCKLCYHLISIYTTVLHTIKAMRALCLSHIIIMTREQLQGNIHASALIEGVCCYFGKGWYDRNGYTWYSIAQKLVNMSPSDSDLSGRASFH